MKIKIDLKFLTRKYGASTEKGNNYCYTHPNHAKVFVSSLFKIRISTTTTTTATANATTTDAAAAASTTTTTTI